MKIEMTRCDNPKCNSIGQPESRKPYAPPYGWIHLNGYVQGFGPNLRVEVCSDGCLGPAVAEQRRKDREG